MSESALERLQRINQRIEHKAKQRQKRKNHDNVVNYAIAIVMTILFFALYIGFIYFCT